MPNGSNGKPARPGLGAGAALTPQKRALLARLLQKKGIELQSSRGRESIPRRTSSEAIPMSFAQEAVWFVDQLDPDQALNSVPCAVRLSGQLDAAALEASLAEIVRRHETLRTRFVTRDGKPCQVISPPAEFRLTLTDLSDRSPEAAEKEAERLAIEEAHRLFDLERGPLFRAFLLRLNETTHVLVFNFHHTVTDGWSMAVFTRELDQLYRAFLDGKPSPLAELPIQFADFAIWQREELRGETLESHLDYWRKSLGGKVAELKLPADRPRPAVQSYRGSHVSVRLSAELSSALRRVSQDHGVTLSMTLTAAFKALLWEMTRETDMVIGSAVAHRDRTELEGLIAFLVNMVVLRTDLSGNPTFGELARRVRDVTLGACAHQEVPLARIMHEVQPERDLGRNPMFQVEFSLLTPDQNPAVYGYGLAAGGKIETIQLPGLEMSPFPVQYENARYDIAIFVWDMPDGIQGTLEYSTDLFDEATITRMVSRWERLLGLIVETPNERLEGFAQRLAESDRARQSAAEAHFEESAKKKLGGLKRRRAT